MSALAEGNKVLVRRFFEEAWIKRNSAAVDAFMAADYMEHPGIPGSRSSGRDGLKQLISWYHGAFPDLRSSIEDMLAEGDRVGYRWTARGTHLGEWPGISPTGNHMTAGGIAIFRVTGGRIVEGWVSLDLRRSDEELRWLTERGLLREPSPEESDVTFDPYSSAHDVLARNLTWRIRAEKARERERVEHELRVARRIQQGLLPKATPKLDGWRLAACYRPARQVGGDFYDFVELPNGLLGIIVGDATGHGVPAALLMATTRGMLRAIAQSLDSPGGVLARVNDAIHPETPPNMFVTCFYAILDPADGRLRYANAGHDLPYLRRDGQRSSDLRARGMPLGLMPGMSYEENEASLESGESVLFYSDGLVEAHNPRREMFGFPRLRGLVDEFGGDGGSLVERLLTELSGFVGADSEQEDDITLVTLQRLRAT